MVPFSNDRSYRAKVTPDITERLPLKCLLLSQNFDWAQRRTPPPPPPSVRIMGKRKQSNDERDNTKEDGEARRWDVASGGYLHLVAGAHDACSMAPATALATYDFLYCILVTPLLHPPNKAGIFCTQITPGPPMMKYGPYLGGEVPGMCLKFFPSGHLLCGSNSQGRKVVDVVVGNEI